MCFFTRLVPSFWLPSANSKSRIVFHKKLKVNIGSLVGCTQLHSSYWADVGDLEVQHSWSIMQNCPMSLKCGNISLNSLIQPKVFKSIVPTALY